METKIRVLQCYVWSLLLYGCEAWTVSKTVQKKLQASEMLFFRRMLKISWTEKKSNHEVLNMAWGGRQLLETLRKQQLEYFGHVMRRNGLEKLVVTGKIEGTRAKGRQRTKYLDSLSTCWLNNITLLELIKATEDRGSSGNT